MIFVILLRMRITVAQNRFVLLLLTGTVLLLCLQLVPLPPALWTSLPGRNLLAEIAPLMRDAQPYRPISMSPDATQNALFSLLIPIAMAILMACLSMAERAQLAGIVLLSIAFTAFTGVIQFSGINLDNPLINETAGASSGVFANRNHQALMLAVGISTAAYWAFALPTSSRQQRTPLWRIVAAIALILWFTLMILATGSRAGLLLGTVALVTAPGIIWQDVRQRTAALPRWVLPTAIAGLVACIGIVLALSIGADRAVSFERIASMDVGIDMRTRGLPVVLSMIGTYFPVGAGAGTFDPVFRVHEPFSLLKLTYFNHAHNDYLEILLDTGIVGGAFLLTALAWWAWRSVAVWRPASGSDRKTARLGSTVILLVLLASMVDYPARTPIIMALLTIAGAWLAESAPSRRPLRDSQQHL